uniref:Reverse transcriptase Ty1/copia-type domain-containing protein n=1 Tax=Vitis vinifera TaxID=29760 RepID=A5B6P5_VITVI|nr:hypothetical protein VITISV_024936 [Vitis vinifera]
MFLNGDLEEEVYIDTLLGFDNKFGAKLKRCSTSEFEIKDLGPLRYFFGMKVAQSKKGIVVSQQKYVLDILKEIGMSNCRPVDTLMDHNQKLRDIKKGDPIDKAQY